MARTAEEEALYSAVKRERYRLNPGKQKASNLIWLKANAEKAKAGKAAWYARNRDAILAKRKAEMWKAVEQRAAWIKAHPRYHADYTKAWRLANPDKHAACSANRRARRIMATPAWANHDLIYSFYRMAQVFGLEVDHIIPLRSKVVCGLHVQHNLQLLTREQNMLKGNRFKATL